MRESLFRLATGLGAIYHLGLGAALLILPAAGMGGVVRVFLGAEVEIDPRLAMAGKFAAGYLLAFGVMLGLLCMRPNSLKALVVPALILFGVRIANKLVFLQTIEESFGITRGRSLFALACLVLLFGIIAFTRPKGTTCDPS